MYIIFTPFWLRFLFLFFVACFPFLSVPNSQTFLVHSFSSPLLAYNVYPRNKKGRKEKKPNNNSNLLLPLRKKTHDLDCVINILMPSKF